MESENIETKQSTGSNSAISEKNAFQINKDKDFKTTHNNLEEIGIEKKSENHNSSNNIKIYDFRKGNQNTKRYINNLTRSIFFVGFMGAGKTSVARKLARKTSLSSLDMDTYIERECQMPINEMFHNLGEEQFRIIETQTLEKLLSTNYGFISCGGGVIERKESRDILRDSAYVIYLQVSADEAASRITNYSSRPLFKNLDNARRLISKRIPMYEEVANLVIDTSNSSSSAIAHDILSILRKKNILVSEK